MNSILITGASKGIPPNAVVDRAIHALESDNPKNRYLIGAEARITAALVRFLPENLRTKLVLSRLGFTKQEP